MEDLTAAVHIITYQLTKLQPLSSVMLICTKCLQPIAIISYRVDCSIVSQRDLACLS